MTPSSECTPMRIFGLLDRTAIDQRAELILAASFHMTPDCWAAERILAQTKWFDYRFLSPIQATQFFVEEYQRIFRWKWRLNFNSADADKKRGTAAGGLFHDRKEFSGFWNARAHADLLGVPYEIYISTAMETALRRAKQKRLLRAEQMRQDDCVVAIQKRWDEELAGARWLSELPHYRAENDHSLPDQIAHQQHVASGARKRSNCSLALGAAIDELRVLPVETAETIYGTEFISRARERSAGIGVSMAVEALPPEQLVPSCFGLPAPLDITAEPCSQCPLADQCQEVSERMLADVVARHGSMNPTLDHRRKLGSERVRRFREKRRLVAGAANEPAVEAPGVAA